MATVSETDSASRRGWGADTELDLRKGMDPFSHSPSLVSIQIDMLPGAVATIA
tara:strand:- start:1115 stop:1273 length:159 start_codon:yes stop_codon:yes gene_type:complete